MKITKYNNVKNISGNKLKELRKDAKMSQQDLAEKLQLGGEYSKVLISSLIIFAYLLAIAGSFKLFFIYKTILFKSSFALIDRFILYFSSI